MNSGDICQGNGQFVWHGTVHRNLQTGKDSYKYASSSIYADTNTVNAI
jgi:hypothetical protein